MTLKISQMQTEDLRLMTLLDISSTNATNAVVVYYQQPITLK